MDVSASQLHPEDRLDILRETDPIRKWRSLDDRRICVVCDRVITGRQIKLTRYSASKVRVACPTDGCAGSPREWVYPGNPLVSEKAWADWAIALSFDPAKGTANAEREAAR